MTNRPNATRLRRSIATTVAVVAASLAAGCSFSWDSSGIKDVLFGGKKPGEIVAAGEPAPPPSSTNADAAPVAPQAAPPADVEDDVRKLRMVAVLPVAYLDASGGGQPCDLCPPSVQMKPTTPLQARLATGFTYEAIARHPRILFPTPQTVEKAMTVSPTHSFRQAAAQLANLGKADLVIASALMEVRPRVGLDDAPTSPAGVAIYVSLVDARTGEVIWSDTFDQNETGRAFYMRAYDKLMNDRPVRWSTGEAYTEYAIDELVEDLVDEIAGTSSSFWFW